MGGGEGIKARRPKESGGLGMEICLNSEDLSVALYANVAEAEAAPLMGYHPQRRGGKVQAAEI